MRHCRSSFFFLLSFIWLYLPRYFLHFVFYSHSLISIQISFPFQVLFVYKFLFCIILKFFPFFHIKFCPAIFVNILSFLLFLSFFIFYFLYSFNISLHSLFFFHVHFMLYFTNFIVSISPSIFRTLSVFSFVSSFISVPILFYFNVFSSIISLSMYIFLSISACFLYSIFVL